MRKTDIFVLSIPGKTYQRGSWHFCEKVIDCSLRSQDLSTLKSPQIHSTDTT